jgi:glucose/arabinose dehydrogenase
MNKKIVIGGIATLSILLIGIGGYVAVEYFGLFLNRDDQKGVLVPVRESSEDSEVVPSRDITLRASVVSSDLEIPWGGVFTSESRLLLTQRTGSILEIIIENGQEISRSVIKTYDQIQGVNNEEGLMAITLDPEYDDNGYVYIAAAFPTSNGFEVDILRYVDEGGELGDETVLIDGIPAARFHSGTQLGFGPDGYLYIATGDALDKDAAQDTDSLLGKILRVDRDGNQAPDNPFNNSVYALGFRNPQGFDWSPVSDELWLNDHGPSGFDGPQGGDEVNRVLEGLNYGWPIISHSDSQEGLESPDLEFTPAVAPGTSTFYTGDVIPEFYNNYFFGGLRGEGLFRVIIDPNNPSEIQAWEKVDIPDYGRIRSVFEGPQGELYITTSNTDGRGDIRSGDDKLIRITSE